MKAYETTKVHIRQRKSYFHENRYITTTVEKGFEPLTQQAIIRVLLTTQP